MNILFVSDNFSAGGLETHIETFFKGLKENFPVNILYASSFKDIPYFSGVDLFSDKLFNIEIKGYSSGSILRLKEQIDEIVNSYSVDVIHAHPFISVIASFLVAVEKGIPLALTLHGKLSLFAPDGPSNLFLREVVIPNSLVFSVNRSVLPSANYLPNLIDEDFWRPSGIESEGFALIVSRLDPDKVNGVKLAIETFKTFEVPVVVAGDGSERKVLEEEFEGVSFVGFKFGKELKELMEKSMLVCGMGRVVLESLFLGKPTVLLNYEGRMTFVNDEVFLRAEKFNFNGSNLSGVGFKRDLDLFLSGKLLPTVERKKLEPFSARNVVKNYYLELSDYLESFKGYSKSVKLATASYKSYLDASSRLNDLSFKLKSLEEEYSSVKGERDSLAEEVARLSEENSRLKVEAENAQKYYNMLMDIYSGRTWKLATKYFKVRDRVKKILGIGVKASYEEELKGILKENKGKPRVVFCPVVDWNIPLFQRPHHIAINLSKLGMLYFYCTTNAYDRVNGFERVSDGCYLTDQFELIDRLKDRKIYHIHAADRNVDIDFVKKRLSEGHLILYEYMDELHEDLIGSVPKSVIERHRFILSDERCMVVATANNLYEEVARKRKGNFILVTNGVDYEHFSRKFSVEEVPTEIKHLVGKGNPIIGYFGALASWFDYELIRFLAESRPDYQVLLIGWDYDGSLKKSGIQSIENVHVLGPIDYNHLPRYAYWFDVSTIPFVVNDITKSTSPIKLYEYMALGKPIVTTDLPECRKHKSVLVSVTHGEFVEAVDKALSLKEDENYMNILKKEALSNTWEAKARQIAELIKENLEAR